MDSPVRLLDFLDEQVEAIVVSDTGVYVASYTVAFCFGCVPVDPTETVNLRKYDFNGGELWTRQFLIARATR